ncbi:MAG TPA: hypothetical protein PK079_03650 [Leptospiraceae bacterium]|nr:hypothetical protein [Leptospiraceae bacterium]HMW03615.1 hypothetical protein [Leptospiraceae bacterium]HMX31258.1 hypothetical protein [Leptospiraceae bacterium]HMY29464.1 hypothetical protein [Leptospiraceae bacterium]HMZ64751.1 hypothetical protein [Leptospiraceae bacterium]
MAAKFLITLCIFFTYGILAQAKSVASNASIMTADPGDALREKALQDSIKEFEAFINAKVSEIERLQTKIVTYDQRLRKVITIVNENTLSTFEEHQNYSVVRYIEYEFESSKLKEVRFIYKKKSLRDNVIYVYRTMYMTPGNFDGIKIITEKVEQKAKGVTTAENYKDFSADVKLRTLKTIDTNLLGSIYKMDGYLQNAAHEKDKKSHRELEGF